jgi:hypothetical protein
VQQGIVCRPSIGDCDPAETCDGMVGQCPSDVRAPSAVVCRPPAGPCDVAETCDGVAALCPADETTCGLYACTASGCKSTCATTSDCALSAVCDLPNGKCR